MATYYKIDGHTADIKPTNGESFTYKELQNYVGSRIEIVPLPNGRSIILHEEGKIIGLPKNEKATTEWKKLYPIEKYPNNNDELIVGDAIITEAKYIR